MFKVEMTPGCKKDLKKLDPYIQRMIAAWIHKNLVNCDDPRTKGKALKGNHVGEWRYRIGDYRLLCQIYDEKMVIVAVSVGHRSAVYLHEDANLL